MASRLQKYILFLITIALASYLVSSTKIDDEQSDLKLPANHRDLPASEQVTSLPAHRSSRQYDSSVTASSSSLHGSSHLDTTGYNSNPSNTIAGGYESQHASSSSPSSAAASAANLISSLASGSSDIGSLTSALASGAQWPNQQYHQEPTVGPPYQTMQYPYHHASQAANQRHWPTYGGHAYNRYYGSQQYSPSLFNSMFNTPIHSNPFGSGTGNLWTSSMTPFMNKALDLPEIVCNAIALAVGTIIIGAPFVLIYLLVSNHMNGGSGPGGLGSLFGNLGGNGLGGHSASGGSITLTGPNSQTNGNGRRKRQVNETRAGREALLRQAGLLGDGSKQLEFALKSLIDSLAKYSTNE